MTSATTTGAATMRGDALRLGIELFALSFVALFLELMVIRWAPSVVRLVAYYANLMLISSFLGLGFGAVISASRLRLYAWLPLLIALNVGVLLLAQHISMPTTASEFRFYDQRSGALNYLVLIGIFATNAAVFVPLGQRIGALFNSLPPLKAYAWDLGGSLVGTLVFGLFSLGYFSPIVGMALVLVIVLSLLPRGQWPRTVPLFALTVFGVMHSNDPHAIWSPYYYITVRASSDAFKFADERSPSAGAPAAGLRTMRDPPAYMASVNHDFYQPHATLDYARFSPERRAAIEQARVVYDLPYVLAPRPRRVLVLGAGGGSDTEVAVLNGAEVVDAVEIDPALAEISRRFNASGIYDHPKVKLHINDARAFLRQAQPGYDLVVFGWLDSQTLFSSMSNLRLDGYIYTVESMRAAYALLNEGGLLALSFRVR